eukprot:1187619-Prorocentrum_minimum.AAC.3
MTGELNEIREAAGAEIKRGSKADLEGVLATCLLGRSRNGADKCQSTRTVCARYCAAPDCTGLARFHAGAAQCAGLHNVPRLPLAPQLHTAALPPAN